MNNLDIPDLINGTQFTEKQLPDRSILLSPEFQIKKDLEGNILQVYIKTTAGRILLNQSFHS